MMSGLKYILKGFQKQIPRCYIWICLLVFAVSCTKEVALPVSANFSRTVIDNDFSIPVRVAITNTTEGADTYNWTFEGGSPATSSDRNPGTIVYNQAGTFTIRLEASNRDESFDVKETTITIDDEVIIGFSAEILVDNFPPMEVALTNTTVGANTFNWTFEGGVAASSSEENPANVIFSEPGDHVIRLEVSNGLETFMQEEVVTVAPNLEAIFDYEVAFDDDDLQVPVTLTMQNLSISATAYSWTLVGGVPEMSSEENPTFTIDTPGIYTIELEATNGKATQTVSQEITVLPNTNLRTFQDLKFGINTAHNNNEIGAFFSTTTRENYTKEQVTNANGADIDLAFFGFNANFTNNKFIAPDEVTTVTFDAIPNATHTKFINVQDACGCSASLTVAEFDAMADDAALSALTITETPGGLQDFDDSISPRIVLFETEDGRKGAIKIKTFTPNGQNSYITVDLKVQKETN